MKKGYINGCGPWQGNKPCVCTSLCMKEADTHVGTWSSGVIVTLWVPLPSKSMHLPMPLKKRGSILPLKNHHPVVLANKLISNAWCNTKTSGKCKTVTHTKQTKTPRKKISKFKSLPSIATQANQGVVCINVFCPSCSCSYYSLRDAYFFFFNPSFAPTPCSLLKFQLQKKFIKLWA